MLGSAQICCCQSTEPPWCGPGPEKSSEDWDRAVFIVMPPSEPVPCVSEVKPITHAPLHNDIFLYTGKGISQLEG